MSWVVGFVLAFSLAVLFLLVYSFDQPSLWLPILFGAAFFGLLWFTPRLTIEMRVGLATLFGAVSCILWIVSSSAGTIQSRFATMELAFENLLGVMGLIGLVVAASAISQVKPQSRPVVGPIAGLMIAGWLISYFSSSHGGGTPMVQWMMHTFGWDQQTADTVNLAVRKTIHFSFYGLIATTAFLTPIKNGALRTVGIIAALLTTLAYSSFDEIRQSSQADRSGSAWDVALDMTGGSVCLIVVTLLGVGKLAGGPKTARRSSTL